MRVYGVVSSHTEDAPLLKKENKTKFATAGKIALLTVGLTGGMVALTSNGASYVRMFGLGTSSLAEKCEDLNAIPQCPFAKLGANEAEKLLDSVQCTTSKAQVKMYATGPCAVWPEGHAPDSVHAAKVGRRETNSKAPSEKSSASSSISGAVNDKTVVEDTQKFNQNLQDNVNDAEKQVENAEQNVEDAVQNGYQNVKNTWDDITGSTDESESTEETTKGDESESTEETTENDESESTEETTEGDESESTEDEDTD